MPAQLAQRLSVVCCYKQFVQEGRRFPHPILTFRPPLQSTAVRQRRRISNAMYPLESSHLGTAWLFRAIADACHAVEVARGRGHHTGHAHRVVGARLRARVPRYPRHGTGCCLAIQRACGRGSIAGAAGFCLGVVLLPLLVSLLVVAPAILFLGTGRCIGGHHLERTAAATSSRALASPPVERPRQFEPPDPERVALNAVIYAAAQAGDARGAVRQLKRMQAMSVKPDAVSFNAVISACARVLDVAAAGLWLRRMVAASVQPDAFSYSSMVKVCCATRSPQMAAGWLQEMLDAGFEPSEASYNMVADRLAEDGDTVAAAEWRQRLAQVATRLPETRPRSSVYEELLASDVWRASSPRRRPRPRPSPQEMPQPSAESDAATASRESSSIGDAIVRCARGDPARAASWLQKLLSAGLEPGRDRCYEAIAEGFARRSEAATAAEWLERTWGSGRGPSLKACNAVLEAYAALGDAAGVAQLLQGILDRGRPVPDVSSFNAAIRSCSAGGGEMAEAVAWFRRMGAEKIEPDAASHAALVMGFASRGLHVEAAQWLEQTSSAGFALEGLSGVVEAVVLLASVARRAEQAGGAAEASRCLEHVLGAAAQAGGADTDGPAALVATCLPAFAPVISSWIRQEDFTRAAEWLNRQMGLGYMAFSPAELAATVRGLAAAGDLVGAGQLLEQAVRGTAASLCADAAAMLAASCAEQGAVEQTAHWLQWLAENGLAAKVAVACVACVGSLAKGGHVSGAASLLERLLAAGMEPGVVCYNTVISGYASNGEATEAVSWFTRMCTAGVVPDVASCGSVVNAWAKAGDVERAEEWLENLRSQGYALDQFAYTSVIDLHAGRGDTTGATRWLDRMLDDGLRPDQAAYNAVINGWARRGEPETAARLLRRMAVASVPPNAISYTTMINCFAQQGKTATAVRWFREMLGAGVAPSRVAYNALVNSCARCNDTAGAVQWLEQMRRNGMLPDVISYNTVINSCARRGDPVAAAEWLSVMRRAGVEPDEFSYNAVINGCARKGDHVAADRWLTRMSQAGVRPGVLAWSAVIAACMGPAAPGAEERHKAEETFTRMLGEGVQPTKLTLGTLRRVLGEERARELGTRLLGSEGMAIASRAAFAPRPRPGPGLPRPPGRRRPWRGSGAQAGLPVVAPLKQA